jgi:hypothetical protein
MKTPSEILDLLQPIISIFFYQIPYKHRAVLILSDNVAEISCKFKIRERNPAENIKNIDFPELLKEVGVPKKLNEKLKKYHEIRNEFQHKSPFYTIEEKTSADSVFVTVELIKFLWRKDALKEVDNWVNCGLRIIRLFSSNGNMQKRNSFESKILKETDLYMDYESLETNILIREDGTFIKGDVTGSRIERTLPKKNEAIIQVCSPKYWTYLLQNHTTIVSQFLDDLYIDDV